MAGKHAPQPEKTTDHIKVIAQNRRARFDFTIEEKLEAGLELRGSEVKSLREGNAVLSDAYGVPKGNELFLINCKITPYSHSGAYGHTDAVRSRKLLLHRNELDHLAAKITKGGYTLIPLSLYFKNGRAKVELALCKGKTHGDRRQDIKAREHARDIERGMRPRRK